MAGPNGEDPRQNQNNQTGTRPKSRSSNMSRHASLSSAGSNQALATLMREYQAVSDSLAMAREQIEREGQRHSGHHAWPGQTGYQRQRHSGRQSQRQSVNTTASNNDKMKELELLRSRLFELEAEMSNRNEPEPQSRGLNVSLDSDGQNHYRIRSSSSNDAEEMERNLALLTAQYEKTSQDEDPLELSPGHILANNSLDAGDSRPGVRNGLNKSSDTLDTMPPAMSLLNNSSDTVKLARELRHKRDQLEELMKKNVFTTGVNESLDNSRNQMRVKDNNRFGDTNRASLSDLSSNNVGHIIHQPHQYPNNEDQVVRLQEQVNKLKLALERLTLTSSVPAVSTNSCNNQSNEAVTASQLSQLSVSINQLYSGMFALQRDVTYLTERLASMESRSGTGVRRDSVPSSHEDNRDHLERHTTGDWTGGHPNSVHHQSWDPHHHFSPYPSRELWNSLQQSPGFNNPLHLGVGMFPPNFHVSETDSGVSSGALNNQVSPGIRANNYYDNFRSFSRQNRLSAPPLGSAASAVPLQHQSNAEQTANNANNSGTKPRRKYKINREQNRDSSNRVSAEQSNLRRRTEGANPVLAANTYTSPTNDPATDSLTKNIYSQVGALIQQNDRAPELLARLLQDLTLLGQDANRDGNNMNLDTADTSSFTSEDTRDTRDSDYNRHVPRSSHSRSKVAGKRLTSGPQSGFTAPVASQTHTHYENGVHGAASLWSGSNNGASVAVPKNQQKNLISRERDSITRKMPGWRERMLPRNMQNQEHHEGFGMEQEGFINIQLDLPEDSQVSAGGHIRQDSVVSEDMAETEDLAEADQSHDNNLIYNTREIWAREDSRDLNIDDRDQFMSPSQDSNRESYLPEGVFPVRDSDSPLTPIQNNVANIGSQVQDSGPGHQGLDRVPIRLQSTAAASGGWSGLGQAASQRIEARRLEEEETVASILDEVLASSPELANNQEANNPPSP